MPNKTMTTETIDRAEIAQRIREGIQNGIFNRPELENWDVADDASVRVMEYLREKGVI